MTISVEMPVYCFDVVISQLQRKQAPPVPPSIPNQCFPLFVTWKKGPQLRLRGCIGTFSTSLSLHKGLGEYARISAFEDERFQPVRLEELPQLSCAVSLLVHFEPAQDYRDWTIGVHGIHIYFSQNGRRLNSVYLPEVAAEQGWDHRETLDQLMRKGGWQGSIDESDRLAVRVERFQSEKMTISYAEYLAHKRSAPN